MEKISMRDAFFDELYKIAKKDKDVILISADMGAPSLDKYRADLKDQFINVGIAEQSMATLATGLALNGKKVYTYAIMTFVIARCWELIRCDFSLMKLPITSVGVGAGFSYDDSGPTHHSTDDITLSRVLPNMTIFNASDSAMAANLAELSYNNNNPCYVRLDRALQPLIYSEKDDYSTGINHLKKGKDITLIATGNMVHRAMEVAEKLSASGIETGVVDLFRIKPLNESVLKEILINSNKVATLEEHFLIGGLGSAVGEFILDSNLNTPLKRFGIKDKFYYAYGGRDNILSLCGLSIDTITKEITQWLGK